MQGRSRDDDRVLRNNHCGRSFRVVAESTLGSPTICPNKPGHPGTMTVDFSERTGNRENAIVILNDGSSSLSGVNGAMPKLYDTGAIAPFNADPEDEKGKPERGIVRWVYEMLNPRVAAEGSRPNG